jgi:hypothetical protein
LIRAAIERKVDIHGDKFAVMRDTGAVARVRRVALGSGDHILGAVVNNFYRLAGFQREQSGVGSDHGWVFFFASESAAGFVLHHANSLGGLVENPHQRFVDVIGAL